MTTLIGAALATILVVASHGSALAWSHAGFRGGRAWGGDGSWDARGFRGGTASGGDGYWHGTGANGTTVYGGYDRYYGGTYATYHPPTVVNTYYGGGCYDCGGWNAAGAAAVGVAAGAAIGAAGANAASSNAYAAGYAAGASQYPIGAIYPTLPGGCTYTPKGNVTYYKCGGGVWLSPAFGANGVYYRVVAAP